MGALFREFAEIAFQIRRTRGSNAKIKCAAAYFRSLDSERNLYLAAQYLGEGAFSHASDRRIAIGGGTIGRLAANFCEIDYELVFRACRTATGSTSETVEKLLSNIPLAQEKMRPGRLTLEDIDAYCKDLSGARGRTSKQEILASSWRQMTPLEVKFFLRIIRRGSLRIGFERKSVTSAIAKAFSSPLKDVRYAVMLTGSVGRAAVLAARERLDEARFQLLQPVSFMLAAPIDSRAVTDMSQYVVEEKLDGMRCQAHLTNDAILLFSRDLNDVTCSFPEVQGMLGSSLLTNVVLDGELCVFHDQTIQAFQRLQKRMGVKRPPQELIEEHPVIYVAFDVLFANDKPLFDHSLEKRREVLERLARTHDLPMTVQYTIDNDQDVETLFERALRHGNEGLILKKRSSTYEYGHRGSSWLKVKRPGGSIDTVLIYAHAGSGKRGGTYSDFTLGIFVGDDERYEQEFIPIGKAYGGYTDDELKRLNDALRPLVRERYGPTLALDPQIVIELEYDSIQVNARTKANYTLRLPRFRAIRWDRDARSVNTLRDVERLYRAQAERAREAQGSHPAIAVPTSYRL